ncbi:MAG TPA: ATP-binding protein [Actinomycetota bacterium]|nr:ATP-binding protein [Actinomycetota bacterium]
MFESFVAVPAHFTVEFLGFLVFAGGAILSLSRSELVPGETSNRLSAAVGFAALAAAQVLHGGSFGGAETDGTRVLIGLEAVGLAFIFVGVVGSLKAAATAAAVAPGSWRLQDPLLLAPAAVGLVLFFAAVAGSRSTRTLRRLAAFALLFTVAAALTAGAPGAEFGTRTVSSVAYTAHALKFVSFIALGSWMWSVVRSSIRTRFVASFAVLLVVVVMALSTALTGVISTNVEVEELRQLSTQVRSAVSQIAQSRAEELNDDASTIAEDLPEVKNRFLARADMNGLAQEVRGQGTFELENGFAMTMDPRGKVLGFSGQGPYRDQGKRLVPTQLRRIDILTINGSGVIGEIADRGRKAAASVDLVGRSLVAVVAAHEVTHPSQPNRRTGIIAIGRWVDAQTVEGLTSSLGSDASLLVHGRVLATDLPGKPDRKGLIPGSLRNQVRTCSGVVTGQVAVGDLTFFSAFGCLRNAADDPVATIVLSSPAREIGRARGVFTRILFLIAMGVGAVSLVLAWFSGRAITQPIQDLTAAAGAVREGNLQAEAPVKGEDEVGQLGETFNEMTASLFRMTNDLRDAARQEHDLRARIEAIIESMADGLVAVDAEKRVLAFNPAAEEITGVASESAVGKPIQDVLDARDAQGTRISLPIFELAQGSVGGIYLARKDTDPVPVSVVSAILPDVDGGASGGVAVLRDMTREREIERMKGEFLSNISHELRTPLTPIKGYAEILGRKDLPPEKTQKFAAGILESTARLERIVHLLVDFAAMEAGRLSPKTKAVDLGSMVTDITDDWARRSPKHSVVAEVDGAIPPVSGDERLLRRSIEELMDNAVKFSPRGGTVRVQVGGAGGNGRKEVQITISDEGIGIPPEDMTKIFSDFHQLDGSETRAYGGLGLGLAFVRRIVEAHEGSIEVDSKPEEGTRLTITIPAARGVSVASRSDD